MIKTQFKTNSEEIDSPNVLKKVISTDSKINLLFGKLPNNILILLFPSFIYKILLQKPRNIELFQSGSDPWPGDPEKANAIFQGTYSFSDTTIRIINKPPWKTVNAPKEWHIEANSFEWLRDFKANGGQAARKGCRKLILSWIASFEKWDKLTWHPDILSRRILSWCSHGDFILKGADDSFRQIFLNSLARQSRHLEYSWRTSTSDLGTISSISAMLVSHTCFQWKTKTTEILPKLFEIELNNQITTDGCHISRNPSNQLKILRNLIWIKHSLLNTKHIIPPILDVTINRMGSILKSYRYGDGLLALFHGGYEENRSIITETLATIPKNFLLTTPTSFSSYERLSAGPSIVLVDVGAPSIGAQGENSHASTLAFEFSIGRERLIVNCGHRDSGSWKDASRSTAAHSTCTLGNLNSSEILPNEIGKTPKKILTHRNEHEGNIWIEAQHDGYLDRLGLFHLRRIYLSSDGTSFRGEDMIKKPASNNISTNYSLRFHLHQDVRASLTSDGALLRLRGGMGWNFRAKGGKVSIEESVYFGIKNKNFRTEQIVISGPINSKDMIIKWSFSNIEALR